MSKNQKYVEVVMTINVRVPVQDETTDDWYVGREMSDQISNAVAERMSSDDMPSHLKDALVIAHDWKSCWQVRTPGMSRNLYTYVLPSASQMWTSWNEGLRWAYDGQDTKWIDGYKFMAERIDSKHPKFRGVEYHEFPKLDMDFAASAASRMVRRFMQGTTKRTNTMFRQEVLKMMEGSFEDGLEVMSAPIEEPF